MHCPLVVQRATGALHDNNSDSVGSNRMRAIALLCRCRLQPLWLRRELCLHNLRLLVLLLAALLSLAAVPHRALGATLADTCAKPCGRFETCVVYESAEFCVQQCAPGRCDDATEVCVLQGVECTQAPCLPSAVCEPKSEGLTATTADAANANNNTSNSTSACVRTCPMIDAPVCASDGVSYANTCIFEEAQCRSPGLALVARGLCAADLAFNLAFSSNSNGNSTASNNTATTTTTAGSGACDAIVCADVVDPVCSSSGTLQNVCFLKRAQCRDAGVVLLSRGACTLAAPMPHCPSSCTGEFAPVCTSTGALYANECLFRQAKCARPFAVGFAARDLVECELDVGDSTSAVQNVRAVLVSALS